MYDEELIAAAAKGYTHFCRLRGNHLDLLTDTPKPCRGCGLPLFSEWLHIEDRDLHLEIWAAIAAGFEELPEDASVARDGWLCEPCRIILDDL